jgi:glycine/D-amino acid oxidase-like deaminating enzyme
MRLSALIVGGGVIGLCSAIALSEKGIHTTVVDVGSSRSPSWGNAGHFAIEHIEPLASPKTLSTFPSRLFWSGGPLDFVWRDVRVWMPWALRFIRASTPTRFDAGVKTLELLAERSLPAWRRLLGEAASVLLSEEGHWVLFEDILNSADLDVRIKSMRTGSAVARSITSAEKHTLQQNLGIQRFEGAKLSNTGQAKDLDDLLQWLRNRARQLGCWFEDARIQRLEQCPGGIAAITDSGSVLTAQKCVVAAGVQSKELLQSLGVSVPLIAERGYHISFENPDWPDELSPIAFDKRSIVMTKFKHRMRATSFVEFGRHSSPPDPRKWAYLEAQMREIGALRPGVQVERWMGSRPTLPDYLPAIGSGPVPGLYYATGHAHLGLTLAALTAELLRDLIMNRESDVCLTPLSLMRFR